MNQSRGGYRSSRLRPLGAMPASGKWRWSTREPTHTRGAAQPGPRQPVVAWPRRQVAAAAVAPAAVLPGVLLTGGRRGKALAACPLLGAAAGGFSGKGAPSAAMLELTASSMAAAWCWLERTGEGRRSERQRVERSAGLLAEQARRRAGERHGHWRPHGSEALQSVGHDEL